jgi:hypothetical protein
MLHGTAAVQAERREQANRSYHARQNQPFAFCLHSAFVSSAGSRART